MALPAPSPETSPQALLDRQMGTSNKLFSVTEHFMKTPRHASFYLASGPENGPLIIFVHCWPELSHSWRYQLRCFGALGFALPRTCEAMAAPRTTPVTPITRSNTVLTTCLNCSLISV